MTSPLALAPVEDSPHHPPPANVPSVPPPSTGPPTSIVQPNPVSRCSCTVLLFQSIYNVNARCNLVFPQSILTY